VIIELVERHISNLVKEIPVMEGLAVENIDSAEIQTKTTIEANMEDSYLVIQGIVDEAYIDIKNGDTKTYQPFYTREGNGDGFQLYLKTTSLLEGECQISIIIKNNEQAHTVAVMNQTEY